MTPLTRVRRPLQIALLTASVLATTGYPSYAQESTAAPSTTPALPSGLAPVSELAVGKSELALDSNGALFRSDDHGRRWRQVHQQWQGKAIELLGIPALAPHTEAQPESFAAVLLKSTAALHWVSVDQGKTWRPSTLDDVRRNDVKWSGY